MKFVILAFLILASISSWTQQSDLSENKFVGKWLWCSGATDSSNSDCSNPLDTLEFKQNGVFIGGAYHIYSKQHRYRGVWTLDKNKRKITVVYESTRNVKMSNTLFLDIHFVSDSLFFQRAVSTVESPGTMFYSYYRRI